jgi:hypothetical protein
MRGHIRKRGKQSYSIVVDIGRDPMTGRRRHKWIPAGRTRRDADRKLAEAPEQPSDNEGLAL